MAKARKQNKRKPIPRQTRHFQLRRNHPQDTHVAEILDYAKSQRREVTVIRDGVRLLWALENNDLSVLFEMFPHLKPQVASGGGGIDEIKAMLEMIARQQNANSGYINQSALPSTPTGKQLAAPKFDLPTFEDDEPTVLIRASTNTDSSMNFVTALRSMQ